MARIELAPEVLADFDRFFEHLAQVNAGDSPQRTGEIIQALQLLAHSPLIGRKVKGGTRELVIGQASRGCVALYRFVPDIDTAFVLAVRSQRESGFHREPRKLAQALASRQGLSARHPPAVPRQQETSRSHPAPRMLRAARG